MVISKPGFEFSSLNIFLEFGPPGAIFNIKELIIFDKALKYKILNLNSTQENGKISCLYEGDVNYTDLLQLFCILTINSDNIITEMKEELIINIEFSHNKNLTCIVQKSFELNFEKVFEIKFNHYSNPLFSFSNIQLKNLCLYSFHMLSFYLDSKNRNFFLFF